MNIEGISHQEKAEIHIDTLSIGGNKEDFESIVKVIETLRTQMNNEWEYGELLQAFGGSLNTDYTGQFFIAQEEGKIAGIAVASVEGEKGKLKAVFVPKAFRGKGVGRMLTEERIQYLRSQGVQRIHIDVTSPGALRIATELKEKYPELIEYTEHGDYFR